MQQLPRGCESTHKDVCAYGFLEKKNGRFLFVNRMLREYSLLLICFWEDGGKQLPTLDANKLRDQHKRDYANKMLKPYWLGVVSCFRGKFKARTKVSRFGYCA